MLDPWIMNWFLRWSPPSRPNHIEWCWGFPYLIMKKVSCLLVSWFHKFTKLPFHIFISSGRYWSHIQGLQDFITRIGVTCRRPSFPKLTKRWIPNTLRVTKAIILKHAQLLLHFFCRYPGVSKDKNSWFVWGGLDTSENPEIIELRSFGFSHKQIEKLLDQIEAE